MRRDDVAAIKNVIDRTVTPEVQVAIVKSVTPTDIVVQLLGSQKLERVRGTNASLRVGDRVLVSRTMQGARDQRWALVGIAEQLSAVLGSAAGAGSGLSVHALSGGYHTGTLADAQAPQFLKTDGSRDLVGNLAVSSGVTIDGVDISEFAANAMSPTQSATITALWTFDRDPNAPFAITAGSAVVTNLDADKLDGYHGSELAALAENETITGDWEFSTRIGVGGGVSAAVGIYNRQEVTALTGTYYGLFVWDTLQPTANYDTSYYATRSRIDVATNFDHTANLIGAMYADARCTSGYTGDINSILGLYVLVDAEDAASTTIARGIRVDTPYVDTGVIVTGYGIQVQQGTTGTGSITTLYGIKVDSITAGETDYSIYTGLGTLSFGDDIVFRQASSITTTTGDLSIDPAGDLYLVSSGGKIIIDDDCNLYRFAGDTLKTDDMLHVGQGIEVNAGGINITAGNLEVDAGDLQVGGGVGVLFVDVSQANVGINCAPDPQFALDIAGNMRTQGYIVGKHAIQIPDALMICHYDGQVPFVWDWTGTPIGHLGQSPVLDLTHYEAGKFGKGVVVGRSTTNLTRDPIFGYGDLTYWTSSGSGTIARTTEKVKYGTAACKVTVTADSSWVALYDNNGSTGADDWYSTISTLGGHTVTASAWVYQPSGQPLARLVAFDGTDAWVSIGSAYAPAVYDEWIYFHYTFTITAGSTRHWVRLQLGGNTGEYCYADGLQFEDMSFPTSLCCGAFQDCVWQGTAHASTSGRLSGKLAYNVEDIDVRMVDESCGTILVWAFSNDWDRQGASSRYCLRVNEGSDYVFVGNTDVEAFRLTWRGGGSVGNYDSYNAYSYLTDYSWHLFGMTWDFRGTTARVEFSVDGVSVAVFTDASPFDVQPNDYFYVGNYSDNYQWNEPIDDLVIAGYPMDIDEILAIYESDAPVFAETSVFHFSAGGSLVWADTEGLWARTIDGDASLGWSGVDSKAWGGHTLNQGDFLLGNTSAGWILWDANPDGSPEMAIGMGASSNKVITLPSSGNAEIVGTLEVTGYIKAGLERLTLDANGLWGVENSGDKSLGWSAVDAVSWGGKTLNSGDFLLGNTDGAWLHWDQDYGTYGALFLGQGADSVMKFHSAGDAEIIGTLAVTSPGEITAGGGAVTLDASGISLLHGTGDPNRIKFYYNTTTVGTVNVYTSGISTMTIQASGVDSVSHPNASVSLRAVNYNASTTVSLSIGTLTPAFLFEGGNAIVAWDQMIGGGLYVGSTILNPPTGEIYATSDIRSAGGLCAGSVSLNPGAGDVLYTGALEPYRSSTQYTAYVPVNFYHNSVSSPVTIDETWTNIFSITSTALGSPPSGKISVRGSITIQVTSFSASQNILLRIVTNGVERQRQYANIDRAWEAQQVPINWTGDYTSGGTVSIAASKADSSNTIQAMATYSHIDVINYT